MITGTGLTILTAFLTLLMTGIIIAGAIMTIVGGVSLFSNLAMHNGQDLAPAIWKIVGGIGIIATASIMKIYVIDPAIAGTLTF